ncbi:GlxA family transcriptional regulator [Cupriavidus consociatus]|uniref:GlxA family transcriptional regulator n=1 Tax=Cupriavidus consociatus TaxID=2821357 RepID=UPI001AE3BFC7|nr:MULTISPECIES: GlxA family transcriptional regulator [unclassified Cupriavidus]MBP0624043.1 GlxA family transcriptional regulator [Cupriavidus sp. LEh25]MDK2660753.1 GlxA family transcriptional regulator [Cupriavidus sp. LEh21]
MALIPPPLIPRAIEQMPRNVVFVAYPDVSLLDLAGPKTVFWAASNHARERGMAGYRCHTASMSGGVVAAAEGTSMQTVALASFDRRLVDTIVVPGSPNMLQVSKDSRLLIAWLTTASSEVRRMASVCSGAFLLAYAGILDGKRATTHWAMLDRFRELFPTVELDPEAIFVQQQHLWTSAGVATGIDLALAMVEEDYGHEVALNTAKELAVYMKRPGAQPQLSELLISQSRQVPVFDTLHLWIVQNLSREELSVEQLAGRVGMSPRNFARVYKQKTGRTPAKSVEHFRLEAARRLLQDQHRAVDQIARECGFGNEERMRAAFQRHFGHSPSDYRVKANR